MMDSDRANNIQGSEKVFKTINQIVIWFLLIWLCLIVLMNIGFMVYTGSILYSIPAIFVFYGIYHLLRHQKLTSKWFMVLIFFLSLLTKLLVVLLAKTPPISDFKVMLDASINFSHQDYSFSQTTYFMRWAYQTGFVIYQGIIYQLAGGTFVLTLLNCLWMSGCSVLVYCLAKKVASEGSSRLFAVLYLLYPANFFLVPVLTNQHLSLFLLYLGLYVLLVHSDKVMACALSGVIVAFSKAIRPDAIILVCAIVFVTFLGCVKFLREKVELRLILKKVAPFFMAYLLVGVVLSGAVKISGINPNGLENNDPLWKIVVGLNHESYGVFSKADADRYYAIEDDEQRKTQELEGIRSRFFDLRLPVTLMVKQGLLWADYEDMYWGFHHLKEDFNIFDVLKKFDKGYYVLVLSFAGYFLYTLCRKYKKQALNNAGLMLVSMLFVFIVIYSLIEIQVRYRYLIMPVIFILASLGYDKLNKVKRL